LQKITNNDKYFIILFFLVKPFEDIIIYRITN